MAVFLPDSKDSNDYWHYPLLGVRQAIEEISDHGINIEYHFFDLNDEQDFIQKGNSLVALSPDVVITAPMFEGYQNEVFSQFEKKHIKYALIDSDVADSSRISFVGQHSARSGQVAGRLMATLAGAGSDVLIANVLTGSDITPVIQKRIEGFKNHISTHMPGSGILEAKIPLTETNPVDFIRKLRDAKVKGIFVPGSRAHVVASHLKRNNLDEIKIVGYDLIDRNIQHLKDGNIEFLISQRPVKQGYHGVMSLFNHLIKKQLEQENIILPIDIILKENVDDYISSIQL